MQRHIDVHIQHTHVKCSAHVSYRWCVFIVGVFSHRRPSEREASGATPVCVYMRDEVCLYARVLSHLKI